MIDTQCALRSFGVPLDGPSWMFGNNKSVVTSSTISHSTLGKHWNALSYHRVREAVAGGWVRFENIPGTENAADILTKPLPWFSLDAPSDASDPEGSDAGPGSTVPEEQLSHGRDSSNTSGHAIPAVPHGDQCVALFDAEPTEDEILHGGQTVAAFDLLELLGLLCSQISILTVS